MNTTDRKPKDTASRWSPLAWLQVAFTPSALSERKPWTRTVSPSSEIWISGFSQGERVKPFLGDRASGEMDQEEGADA